MKLTEQEFHLTVLYSKRKVVINSKDKRSVRNLVIEHRDIIVSILVYTINGPVKVLFITSNLLPAGGSSSANGPQHLSSDFYGSSGQKKKRL